MVRKIFIIGALSSCIQGYVIGMENEGRSTGRSARISQNSLPPKQQSSQQVRSDRPRKEKKKVSIFEAAKNGDIACIRELLRNNPDPNAINTIDPEKGTLICCAIKGLYWALQSQKEQCNISNYEHLFKFLVQSGADVTLYPPQKNYLSIAHLFTRNGYEQVKKIFETATRQSVTDPIQKRVSTIFDLQPIVPAEPTDSTHNLDVPERPQAPAPEVQASYEMQLAQNIVPAARPSGAGEVAQGIKHVAIPVQRHSGLESIEVSAPISVHPAVESLINAHPNPSPEGIIPPAIVASIIRQQAEQGAHAADPVAPAVAPQVVPVQNAPLPEVPQVEPQKPSSIQSEPVSVQQEPVLDSQEPQIHHKDESSAGVQEPHRTSTREASQGSSNLNFWSKRVGAALGVGFAGIVFYKWLKQVQARARQKPVYTTH